MTTILPNQILPIGVRAVDEQGRFTQNWWLLFYNMIRNSIGTPGNATPQALTSVNLELDAEVDSTDYLTLVQRVQNLENVQVDQSLPAAAYFQFIDDSLVPPVPQAQRVQTLTVGASPWVYQALADGSAIITGTATIQLSRDGITYYTVNANMIPMSRLDSLKVTYSSAPTAVYFPR